MKLLFLGAAVSVVGLLHALPAGAASASVRAANSFGQLTLSYVAGPGEANDVSIAFSPDFSGVDVKDSGATISAGAGCTSLSAHRARCDVSSGDLIRASLRDGNDILSISHFFDSGGGLLSGGDGDDLIRGNDIAGTNEILLGGRGNDALFGRGGSEFLEGGPGADDLMGGTSCEPLTAGQCALDTDTVSYAGRTKRVHATADGIAADDGQRREHDTIAADIEQIIGGAGNDILGGPAGMQLEGRAGNDVLRGGRASDRLRGGKGDDVIRGAGGPDWLRGGPGDDQVFGDSGGDRLAGGRGGDELLARDGRADRVNGGPGTDEAQIDPGLDGVRKVETLS